MNNYLKSGALIAATVASMAMSASAFAAPAAAADTVHCAGQNTCKGHGFLETKASECTAKGGKIIDSK